MLIKCPKCKIMFDENLNACPSCGLERHISSLLRKDVENEESNLENKKIVVEEKKEEKIKIIKEINLEEREKIDDKIERLLNLKKAKTEGGEIPEQKSEELTEEAELVAQEPVIEEINPEEKEAEGVISKENILITSNEKNVEEEITKPEEKSEEKPEEKPEEITEAPAEEEVKEPEKIVIPEIIESNIAETKEEMLQIPPVAESVKEIITTESISEPIKNVSSEENIGENLEIKEKIAPLENTSKKEEKIEKKTKQRKTTRGSKRIIVLAIIFILFIGVGTFGYFYYTKAPDAFNASYTFIQDKIVLVWNKIVPIWDSAYSQIDSLIHGKKINVSISSDPIGADIYIDNIALNQKTPYIVKDVKVGEHTVLLKLQGYDNFSSNFSVLKNQKDDSSVSAKLVQTKTILPLNIISNPAGAQIFINGKDTKEITPFSFNYEPGTYEIELKLKDYKTAAYTQILKDSPEEVNLPLVKNIVPIVLKGTMGLTSSPEGGEVWIDGKDTGKKTPCSFDLALGNYKVVIRKQGYYDWVRERIEIIKGFNNVFFALLTEK